MKSLMIAVLSVLVLAIAGEAAVAYFALGTNQAPPPASRPAATNESAGITVLSEGTVNGKPDVAYMMLGVETAGATAREAMDANSEAMQRIVDRLKSLGTSDADLQTEGLSLYPITGPQGPSDATPPEKIRGYRAHNGLDVTVNDIDKAGSMLDAAIQAGANTSNGIRFGVKDDSGLRSEALKKATESARARADVVAQALGVRITGVTAISEDTSAAIMPKEGIGGGGAGAPIQPGQLAMTARVRVSYSFSR